MAKAKPKTPWTPPWLKSDEDAPAVEKIKRKSPAKKKKKNGGK